MASMAKSKGKAVDLVTGATSELGRRVAEELVARGHEVRAVLHLNPKNAEEWKGVPAGVKPYVADLTLPAQKDRKSLSEACAGVDNVFHIAAAVYNYKNSVDTLMSINVVGTENLLSTIARANKRRECHFIFASSVSVYGYGRGGEVLTEESEVRPKTPYSKSKYIAEQVIQSYCLANPAIKYTILRLGTIYGPGYEHPSFTKVFRMIKRGEMRYIGNGENHLTLIHVDDAAGAFIRSMESPASLNKVYNLTDGEPHTQRRLFSIAAKYMGAPPVQKSIHPILARIARRSKHINSDEFDFLMSNRTVSIARIRRELGFLPKATIDIEGTEMIGRSLG